MSTTLISKISLIVILIFLCRLQLTNPTGISESIITDNETTYHIDNVISAIIQVESSGNISAFNSGSNATGCLQITPILINDINLIYKTQYKLKDAYNCETSCVIFLLYVHKYFNLQHYYTLDEIKTVCSLWLNGPSNIQKPESEMYYNSVINNLKKNNIT